LRRPFAFTVAAVLPAYLALSDGGYDVVVRHEMAVAVWWLLALGFAFRILPRARPPRGAAVAAAGFAVLVGITAVSLAWTSSDARAVDEVTRLLGYAGIVVLAWSCLGPRTWVAAAEGLVVGAIAICAIAVASRLDPDLLAPSEIERALSSERLFQPLGYWNGVAVWAAMAASMALAWSADARRTRVRAAALASAPIAVLAVYLTFSRGGVLSLALGIAIVIVLARNQRRAAIHAAALAVSSLGVVAVVEARPEIANGTGSGGAFAVAAALLAAVAICWGVARATRGLGRRDATPTEAGARADTRATAGRRLWIAGALVVAALVVSTAGAALVEGLSDDDAAAQVASADPVQRLTTATGNRPAYWGAALDAFADEPLRGIGPGTFEFWWAQHGDKPGLVADAHSLYLETLAEVGLVGLLGLVLVLAALAVASAGGWTSGARRAPAPATAMLAAASVYVVAVGFDWMWELTAVSVLGIGAAVILASAGSEPAERRWDSAPGRRAVPSLALAAIAIAAGAIHVPGLVSVERSRASNTQLELGDPGEAVELADDAVSAAPWEAEPYAVRARAERRLGSLHRALEDAQAAVERESLEPEHRLLVAEIEADLGHPDAADAALDSAFFLSPRSPRFRRDEVARLEDRIAELRASGS
jgi:hypothetical protein